MTRRWAAPRIRREIPDALEAGAPQGPAASMSSAPSCSPFREGLTIVDASSCVRRAWTRPGEFATQSFGDDVGSAYHDLTGDKPACGERSRRAVSKGLHLGSKRQGVNAISVERSSPPARVLDRFSARDPFTTTCSILMGYRTAPTDRSPGSGRTP